MTDFTDEDLTAYLDGELPEDVAAQITAALGDDASLAGRLAALDAPLDAMRAAGDQMLSSAPALPKTAVPTERFAYWPAAAALVLGVGLGGFGAANLGTSQDPEWVDAIVSYQSLYTEDTLVGVGAPHPGTPEVIAGYAEDANWTLPNLEDLPGLTLRRAQILGFDGKPLLQMVFSTDQGTPVALCVVEVADAASAAKLRDFAGMNGAFWVDGTHGLVLVGDVDPGLVEATLAALG